MISRSAPASAASAATSSIPGVSTTGSNSLGTVLVAGRKRVPNPAAGTTAVCGIGTRGRVIVHTLSPSSYHIACDGAMSSWTRGVPDQSRDADGDPGGPSRGDTGRPRRGGRSALRPSARRRSAAGKPSAPTSRSDSSRGQSPCWTPCYGSAPGVLLPVARSDADGVPQPMQWGPVPTRPARPGAVRAARAAGAVAARRRGGRRDRRVRARAGGRPGRGAAGARRGVLRPDVAVGRPGGAAGRGGPRRRTRRRDSGRAARRPR